MPETESKGIFLPYPLLGILLTLVIVLVTGIITLEVQVSNLSTTMLLRDADSRAQMKDVQDRLSTMQVYLQNDREKIIRLETQQDHKGKQ